MTFNKIYPYLLVGIAVLGLLLHYKSYSKLSEKSEGCSCQDNGPITDDPV